MRSIRATVATVAAIALTGLTACEKPNLDDTEGGYEEFATPDAAADTGQIAPHEGPAPSDTAGVGTGAAMEDH